MPTTDTAIRLATPADLTYVVSLMRHYSKQVGYCPKGGLLDRIETRRLLVADVNGDPAGYVTYTHRRDGLTHLPQVAVDHALWRTSVGSRLLRRLITDATAAGSAAITLKSAIDLDCNHFWPTLGFRPGHVVQGKRRKLQTWIYELTPNGWLFPTPPAHHPHQITHKTR